MTDETETINLLRAIRAKLDEQGSRLARLETRLSGVEQIVGYIYAGMGDDRTVVQALTRRVAHIERRLLELQGVSSNDR